ncbi:DUF1653 domain-containing protein [Ramlibacter sp. AN1015]|uniref:DUF1653 domain-containing protein n=1 Tax=Ramlibacter sp. AN1015 TaxID=3133428 RepID=UPI0030BB0AB2
MSSTRTTASASAGASHSTRGDTSAANSTLPGAAITTSPTETTAAADAIGATGVPGTPDSAAARHPGTLFAVGTLLRHYKGGRYRVVGACRIEANGETGVLYRAAEATGAEAPVQEALAWMRPLREFFDLIDTPSGRQQRFQHIDPAR